jgi:hypothetical protein
MWRCKRRFRRLLWFLFELPEKSRTTQVLWNFGNRVLKISALSATKWNCFRVNIQYVRGTQLSAQIFVQKYAEISMRNKLLPHAYWFIAWLVLRLCRKKRHVSPKHRLNFNALYDIICQRQISSTCYLCPEGGGHTFLSNTDNQLQNYNINLQMTLIVTQSPDFEDYCLMECDVMWSGCSLSIFRRKAMPPSSV